MTILAFIFFLMWLFGAASTLLSEREMFWICFKQDLQFGGVLTGLWLVLWAFNSLLEKLW